MKKPRLTHMERLSAMSDRLDEAWHDEDPGDVAIVCAAMTTHYLGKMEKRKRKLYRPMIRSLFKDFIK